MTDHDPGHVLKTSLTNTINLQTVSSPPVPSETSGFRSYPFHPAFITAFPILSLYANNIYEVHAQEIWRVLGYALFGCLIVWIIFALLMRHVRKAALAASALTLVFFSYGHIARLTPHELAGVTPPLCVVGLIALLLALIKNRGTFIQTTVILNLVSAVLLVPSFLTITGHMFAQNSGTDRDVAHGENLITNQEVESSRANNIEEAKTNLPSGHHPRPVSAAAAANLTDIYYIILDAYGRADSLKRTYGFDNSPFIHALESRGFYIADRSRANYSQTGYCIPSYLNMNYLNVLLVHCGVNSRVVRRQAVFPCRSRQKAWPSFC